MSSETKGLVSAAEGVQKPSQMSAGSSLEIMYKVGQCVNLPTI